MTTNRHSLDRVLEDVTQEIERQLAGLVKIGEEATALLHDSEAKREKLLQRIEELLADGRDDVGDPIQPNIEEALEWLENETVPEMEDYVVGILETVGEGATKLRELQRSLGEIIQITPPGAFYRPRRPTRRTR